MFYSYKCTECEKKSRKLSYMIDNVKKPAKSHANKENHIVDIFFRGIYKLSVYPTERNI